ncbi:secretin N-terminal domain-containing protein [Botrimarina sp.]|uniref:secretin N-terminal domain-containing protein n=1 Tax=Botrimarina sp. TaxID=2795802 RepID=UPI0032ED86BB
MPQTIPLRRRAAALLAAATLLLGAVGGAAPPAAAEREGSVMKSLERPGDLTLRDATLESALFTISELWGINIVAAKAEGSVNGVFKDAPLREILDSILLSNGYAYRTVGDSLVVSRLQDLGQVNPYFVTQTLSVGAADVDEAVEAARLLSTPAGQVRALPSAGALLVVDFPDRVDKIRDLVRQLDSASRGVGPVGGGGVPTGPRRLEVRYFRTHFVEAAKAAAALEVVLSEVGRAATVEDEDRLLVVDYAEHVEMASAVLARIDRPRPQVNIKALIYDISLSDLEEIGVNWDGITNGSITDGGATGQNSGLRFLTQTAAPLDPTGSGGAFTFYSLEGDLDLRALVVALQQAEDSRLLADPNVTVMDNEPANIESISEIPFQQLTQTAAGGNIGTTAFKPVGIKLDVVPKIANDRTIDLKVVPEFSRLSGFTPGDNQPIIETRRATTRVRVRDRQTIVIAGLRQRVDVGDFNGIPLLKDVRFFGHLFRSRSTEINETELVVFLTPQIVGYSDPLGCRDRRTADTINSRLDFIPAAEGAPPCRECGLEGGCLCEAAVVVDATSLGAPTPATPDEAPVDAPADSWHAPAPAGRGPAFAPAPAPPADGAPSPEALPPTQEAGPGLEEIPPLPPGQPLGSRRPDAAGQPAPRVAAAPPAPDPMRVAYDARYRSTGGVYPGQQRLFDRPPRPGEADSRQATPAGEGRPVEEAPARTGWWEFWR